MEVRRALADLAEVRGRLATLQRFDGYSGNAAVASGVVALGAGAAQFVLAPHPIAPSTRLTYLWIWLICLGLALAINYGAIVAWRSRHPDPQAAAQMRTVGFTILPAIAAGGVVTLALVLRGLFDLLPGMWCATYALGLFAARGRVRGHRLRGGRNRATLAAEHRSVGLVDHARRIRPRTDRDRRDRPGPSPSGKDSHDPMNQAPFAYEGLERIFHERGRLAVCTCLVANPAGMSFTALQEACALTDGNLNRHLHALAETAIVTLERKRGSGRPTTIVRITESGRERFLAYVDELEAVVRAVHASDERTSGAGLRLAAQS